MRRTGIRTGRHGFTLLEVLLSIAMIGALLGSMFAFTHELLRSRSRLLDYTARQLAAATLIDRVESDLIACVVGDAALGAGIDGDASRLAILSRGVAAHLAGRGIDGGVLGDLQHTEYRFQDASRLIEVRRGTPGDGLDAMAGDFAAIGPAYKVRFRYHDGDRWSDTFDSLARNRLPGAVEVAVWYHPWPGEQQVPVSGDAPAAESERLTFDTTGGFDDAAFARSSDVDSFDEPRPDRFRVIVIPDASADDPFATGDDLAGGSGP